LPRYRTCTPSPSKPLEAPVGSDIIQDSSAAPASSAPPSALVRHRLGRRRGSEARGRRRQGRHDRGTPRAHRGVAGHAVAARIVLRHSDIHLGTTSRSRRFFARGARERLRRLPGAALPRARRTRWCRSRARSLRLARCRARRAPRGPRRGSRPLGTATRAHLRHPRRRCLRRPPDATTPRSSRAAPRAGAPLCSSRRWRVWATAG
jgi:hypothetical protein